MLTTLNQISTRHIAKPTTQNMRGAVAVELALLLVFILVPLILGIADLGRMLYQYNALTKSVRDGAKLMSLCNPDLVYAANYAVFQTQAKNLVVFGSTAAAANPLVPGLTTNNVDITQSTSGAVNMVTVTVSRFSLGYITGLPQILDIPALQTFNNISSTMRQSTTCAAPFA